MDTLKVHEVERIPKLERLDWDDLEVKLDAEEKKRYKADWEKACKGNSRLHNNPIFVIGEWLPHSLEVFSVPYASIYLQRWVPYWKNRFSYISLGVSGITTYKNQVLIGKRASWVGQDPGKEELVPSGGVDKFVDPFSWAEEQIITELSEETGIIPSSVAKTVPLFSILDEGERCLDFCLEIQLNELPYLAKRRPKDEYSELHWEDLSSLQKRWESQPTDVAPLSLTFLNQFTDLRREP